MRGICLRTAVATRKHECKNVKPSHKKKLEYIIRQCIVTRGTRAIHKRIIHCVKKYS